MSEALRKLEEYFSFEEPPFDDPETEATHFLVWLYAEGFRVVSVEGLEDTKQ